MWHNLLLYHQAKCQSPHISFQCRWWRSPYTQKNQHGLAWKARHKSNGPKSWRKRRSFYRGWGFQANRAKKHIRYLAIYSCSNKDFCSKNGNAPTIPLISRDRFPKRLAEGRKSFDTSPDTSLSGGILNVWQGRVSNCKFCIWFTFFRTVVGL